MQVSFVLPEVFEECSIRLYCNTKDRGKDEIVEKIIKAFEKWYREKVGLKTHVLFSSK
jgi:broad-specificity NMP kinase